MKKIYIALFLFSQLNIYSQNHPVSTGPIPADLKGGRTHTQLGNSETVIIAYGHESQSTNTISMPIPAGTPFTPLNTFVPPAGGFASSMTKGGDGNHYLVTNAPAFYHFNDWTGEVTLLGSITGMSGQTPNGIGYNFVNSTYYLASSTNLFSFDVTTRVATLIGPFNTGGLMIDLCFNFTGTCYAYDVGTDNAYTVNITTGEATLLGPLGYDANFGQGMSYDFETETIYLSAFNNGTFSGQLRTMNPTTGMTTLIIDWGLQQVAPFSLYNSSNCPVGHPTNPIPTPGTTNVPATGNTLSWTNGSGTTMNEVYFNGNLVYDGPAITSYSLAPHEPLSYSTTYNWRVVCKDSLCGTTGPTWSFTTRQNPLNPYIFFDDFESGLGQWTITNDGGTCVWEIFTPPYPNAYTLPATSSGGVLAADSDECGSGTTMLTTAKVTNPINAAGYAGLELEFDNDFRILDADDQAYVEVSTNGGTTWQIVWSAIGVAVRNTYEIVDLSAYDGMTFEIRFRSVQPGWDWWWVVDNVIIQSCLGCIGTPSNLTAIAGWVSGPKVYLNWDDNSFNESGFQIFRALGDSATSGYEQVGTVSSNITTYTDSAVQPNTYYSYRVRAYAPGSYSGFSNIATVQTLIPVELTNFSAITEGRKINLIWTTASEVNNYGFEVEKLGNNRWENIGFVPGYGTTTEAKNYAFTDHNAVNGTYSYRLRQVDFDGTFEYSPVVEVVVDVPSKFSLSQNYPNPFNPNTTITFGLAVDSKVSLKIFDVLGQEVAILVNGDLAAGNHNINFSAGSFGDASGLNSGVYFYTIEAKGIDGNTFMNTKKMILTK
jgi:hypothetical protein